MASVSLRLHRDDLAAILGEVEKVLSRHLEVISNLPRQPANDNQIGQGIRVVTVNKLAQRLGKSPRQLYRMERAGKLPRRRLLSQRRIGYFEHELEGIPAEAVTVLDRRTLTRTELAAKLSVHKMTLAQLLESHDLPQPNDRDLWQEREIDQWLLSRPPA